MTEMVCRGYAYKKRWLLKKNLDNLIACDFTCMHPNAPQCLTTRHKSVPVTSIWNAMGISLQLAPCGPETSAAVISHSASSQGILLTWPQLISTSWSTLMPLCALEQQKQQQQDSKWRCERGVQGALLDEVRETLTRKGSQIRLGLGLGSWGWRWTRPA